MRTGRNVTIALALLASGTFVGASAQQFVVADDHDSSDLLSFVAIEPCRLADTRLGTDNVGPRASKIGAEQIQVFDAFDSSTSCAGKIPADATSIATNITALGATELSFLTIWADGPQPLAASLNPAPGEPPTPNAVTTALSTKGEFRVFNNAGETHVVIDVNGYYVGLDGRLNTSASFGADIFYVETTPSGFPVLDLTPEPGGYPGVVMREDELSTVAMQFTVGASWQITDGLSIGVEYVPHDDNLIDNPTGCGFVAKMDDAFVTRQGETPFRLDVTAEAGGSETAPSASLIQLDPAVIVEQWEPGGIPGLPAVTGGLLAALVLATGDSPLTPEVEMNELQSGDRVTVNLTRDPMHIEDTCTSDMVLVGVQLEF